MSRLNNQNYMSFPLSIGAAGAATSTRQDHVREQIEQVLFTAPGERWFRPEFGIGVRALVFEPNNHPLWEVTKKRLFSSLSEALAGEVSPNSLQVDVSGEDEKLLVNISYQLATINHTEQLSFVVEA